MYKKKINYAVLLIKMFLKIQCNIISGHQN